MKQSDFAILNTVVTMMSEKDLNFDKFLVDVEENLKSGKGDLIHGSSGCGSCFHPNKPIIISKDERRKNEVSGAVSQRIKDLCTDFNYSINCLSKKSGVKQSTLNDIISGKTKNVGVITIKRICEAFYMNLNDFFCDPLFDEYLAEALEKETL